MPIRILSGREARHSMAEVTERVEQGLRRGESYTDIVAQLVEWGWPEISAQNFVLTRQRQLSVQNSAPLASERQQSSYLGQMLSGLAWLLGGATLTWLSMQGSGFGFVFFGAIIYGMYRFITGLISWWRTRK